MNIFHQKIQEDFNQLIRQEQTLFLPENCERIDLHCHDCNSDVPDELWGRILRVPETFLPTHKLLQCLDEYKVTVKTITNHNNARSCWELLEKGIDVLVAAEFTCLFPEMGIQVHVLTYGFTPAQENKLNKLRQDIYQFMAYAAENDLPTVLAHPLFFHLEKNNVPQAYLEKIAILFKRFEVLNGQRDVWQNLLTGTWIKNLTEEKILNWSKKHNINPKHYNETVWPKKMTGGSDDHMGLFAGLCGTIVKIDSTQEKKIPKSKLILQSLRKGDFTPYGDVASHERLNVAFLDYFCQLGLHIKEPGLLRMFLHQGDLKDKLICLGISNAVQELKRHRYTSKFFKIFHEALGGVKPGILTKWTINNDYLPIAKKLETVAKVRRENPKDLTKVLAEFIPFTFTHLNKVLAERIVKKINPMLHHSAKEKLSFNDIIRKLEVPSHLRNLLGQNENETNSSHDFKKNMASINMLEIFDELSFPALFSGVIATSSLVSTRVLFGQRKFLNKLSMDLNRYEHPKKALWLTDTLKDKNGVSHALQSNLKEIQKRNLPIDFLVCSNTITPEDHLRVTPSLGEFHLFDFDQQKFNVPNLQEVHRIFYEGGYDRLICSTEFLMGPVGLYLKAAFNVPLYFYLHTDWMEFFSRNSDLDEHNLDRIRRLLRAFYRSFDGIFVLNYDHAKWLSSPAIGISKKKIFKTAHWTEKHFYPIDENKSFVFPGIKENEKVLLYTGRLNEEKGVMELPEIYRQLKKSHPHLKMVIAGMGPSEIDLKEKIPEAIFLGWVDKEQLVKIYSAADLLILPSRFDTFGLVILEAMACGLPVAAYDVKGPKDLIQDGVNGVTASTQEGLILKVSSLLSSTENLMKAKQEAQASAKLYDPQSIMDQLLSDLCL